MDAGNIEKSSTKCRIAVCGAEHVQAVTVEEQGEILMDPLEMKVYCNF